MAATIVATAIAAYWRSLSVPFLLDDQSSIPDNPTIRHLGQLWSTLSPPRGEGLTVEGRPLLNFSFAVNHAISGAQVWSYHWLNLLIHIFAGLTLFGIVRRTLRSRPVAFAVALLWTLHPLQTESVTYIAQRAESLMGLLYLLTLYCFIRFARCRRPPDLDRGPATQALSRESDPGSGIWAVLSVSCCFLGMATKEVMVSAPLLVFLYDRSFIAGSIRAAWEKRRGYYLALASTWILLIFLVIGSGNRGGTSGIGSGVSVWSYWPTQFPALLRYLKLSVWPHPLVFDYGVEGIPSGWIVLGEAMVVLALAGFTLAALWRKQPIGFLGAWFFATLAPTSLVPGNRQTLAEHRMYLGLAAPVVLVVCGIHGFSGRRRSDPTHCSSACLLTVAAIAAGFGALTIRRNGDYRSELTLYKDTAEKRPANAFAQCNYGTVLLANGRFGDAIKHFGKALLLKTDYPIAHDNLGNALQQQGRLTEAVDHYETAIRLDPRFTAAHDNLGGVLLRLNRNDEAAREFREVLRLRPADAEAHNGLGILGAAAGRLDEAIGQFQKALQSDPKYTAARYNLANALLNSRRLAEAIAQYEDVLRAEPDNAGAHDNLGNALFRQGHFPEAAAQYQAVLRLVPDHAVAHYNLGNTLLKLGRVSEAIGQYREALRIQPGFSAARQRLLQLEAQ